MFSSGVGQTHSIKRKNRNSQKGEITFREGATLTLDKTLV
jgi:hypothetical protein